MRRDVNSILFSVIPLEDLPELQVGFGFGLVDKENVKKPTFLKVSFGNHCEEKG